jgi:hypothetical protein
MMSRIRNETRDIGGWLSRWRANIQRVCGKENSERPVNGVLVSKTSLGGGGSDGDNRVMKKGVYGYLLVRSKESADIFSIHPGW